MQELATMLGVQISYWSKDGGKAEETWLSNIPLYATWRLWG